MLDLGVLLSTSTQSMYGKPSDNNGDEVHSCRDCGMKDEEEQEPSWALGEGFGPTRTSVALRHGTQLASHDMPVQTEEHSAGGYGQGKE